MTTPSLPVVGLSTTNFLPGNFFQINWAAGQASGTQSGLRILLIGNALASSAIVTQSNLNTVFGPTVQGFQVNTVNDVINECGAGSQIHLMYQSCVNSNQNVNQIFIICPPESTGAASSLTVTFTGTTLANGNVRSYVGPFYIDTPISLVNSSGLADTTTNIATNVANNVNSNANLPVTAAPSTNTVVFTAKNKGVDGDAIRCAVRVTGPGVGITSSAQSFVNLSGGTGESVWTQTLSTIDPLQFDYIVSSNDGYNALSGSLGGPLSGLVTQVVTQSAAVPGIRQRVVAATVYTEGDAIAISQNLDTPLCDLVWEQNSNYTPAQLAAYTAGAFANGESSAVPLLNWDWLGTTPQTAPMWNLVAPFDGTTQSSQTLTSVLAAGVSPVQNLGNGKNSLVSAITTYCVNPATSAPDYRVRDHDIVTVMYLAANLVQQALSQDFSNKLAAPDPPAGAKPPTSAVVTPSVITAAVNKVFTNMYANGLLINLNATLEATEVVLNTSSQFGISVSLTPIVPAHQFAVTLNQLS